MSSISGEMEQPERNRALADFKRGKLRVLVATDVAARGIDVQDIARVIHAEPPDDADSYTHRSGRTGRAGRKGQSLVLSSPSALTKTSILLKRARVQFRIEPIPTADDIRGSSDERLLGELLADDPEGFAGHDDRLWAFAKRLAGDTARVTRTIARLLERSEYGGPTEPREVRAFAKTAPPAVTGERRPRTSERGRPQHPLPRSEHAPRALGAENRSPSRAPRTGPFVPFRVSWGGEQGADARRLLAMVCRRGEVRGADVGNIRIARGFSTVEIAADVATAFAQAAAQPDPRNPRVSIQRDSLPTPTTPTRLSKPHATAKFVRTRERFVAAK